MFNVGKHATQAQFEKILKANGVEYKRAKKTPATTHGVLTFEVQSECLLQYYGNLGWVLTPPPGKKRHDRRVSYTRKMERACSEASYVLLELLKMSGWFAVPSGGIVESVGLSGRLPPPSDCVASMVLGCAAFFFVGY